MRPFHRPSFSGLSTPPPPPPPPSRSVAPMSTSSFETIDPSIDFKCHRILSALTDPYKPRRVIIVHPQSIPSLSLSLSFTRSFLVSLTIVVVLGLRR